MGLAPPESIAADPRGRWTQAFSPLSPPPQFHRRTYIPWGFPPAGECSTGSQLPSNYRRQPPWRSRQLSTLPPRLAVAQRATEDDARLLPVGTSSIPL